MIKNNFLFYILLTFFFTSCQSKSIIPENFVVILVDDLGWKDLSFTGSDFYESPNLDKLSAGSIQFTNAYSSSPICSPARASILTGKHPSNLNITDWIPGDDPKNRKLLGPKDLDKLPLEELTIAEALKEKNYTTFFAGKWHLGGGEFTPEKQGFDINIAGGHYGQPPGGYYSPYKNNKIKDGPDGEYLTNRLTSEAINFIDTNSGNPFFMFLSFYSVHTPIQANREHIKKFKDKLNEIPNHDEVKIPLRGAITRLDQYNPEYASMIYSMDENIGKLIEKLKANGLYENTTIIFTSDNGGLSTLEKNERNTSPTAPTSVAPLKGGKGWLYEGGLKVPFLIKPANFESQVRKIETPIVGSDIFPTILSMAGIDVKPNQKIDGMDLIPLIKGETIERSELFWHYPHYHGSGWTPGSSIKQGNWKLIEFYEGKTFELYNLSTDPYELDNLILKFPEIAESLKVKLLRNQKKTNSKKPILNPNFHDTISKINMD